MIPNTGITNGPNGGAGDEGAGCAVTGGHHASNGAPFALAVVGLLWGLRRWRR